MINNQNNNMNNNPNYNMNNSNNNPNNMINNQNNNMNNNPNYNMNNSNKNLNNNIANNQNNNMNNSPNYNMNNSNNNLNNMINNQNNNMNNNSNYNMNNSNNPPNNNINNNQINNMNNNPNYNMNNNQNNNMNNNINNNLNNNMNYNVSNNMNNNPNNNMNNNNNYSNNTNNYMNNNNMNNNNKYNMNSLGPELAGNGPFRCDKCSMSHCGLKRIKNICPNCFMLEIINQSKNLYINYLKQVTILERANTITRNDLENLFLQKVVINFYNNQYNIYDAAHEFNFPENNNFNVNQKIDEIIFELKKNICCYCYCNVQNNEFTLPCGCNFCSYEHLNSFISEKIQNKLTHNFKCFCSYQYGPNNVMELCNFLRNKNVFKDYNSLIEQLNHLFGGICFKCGREKIGTELKSVDIEGFCPIKFEHFICEECIQNETSNHIECIICKIQHKYLLKDF